ncbi:5-hydroxytryptamine receptor-like [Hydractinia symbiolongicarpus]|uniref:5-hydroxytryptamine receptor-like n=1 Tax=Hydractinia symbiolongicarpus TaxID=13093 RepID=UPI0025517EFC|nr:5-hydroxytryptamine receptor-like [Hydractinia symbiolongicarpus]XP_057307129.1 5-hydroxytryptamine receptor-like [Hydractinia symbiolongicarpus]
MEPGSQEYIIVFSGGIMIIILLSLFGNTLVCFAVYHSRNLRAGVNYLIVSLAVADILIASIAMPIWLFFEITAFNHLSHNTSLILHNIWTFIDILGAIASIANLTAISYERLWSVFSPFKHRRYMTSFTAGVTIFIVWVYAVIVAATNLMHKDWEYVTIYTACIGFFFPLSLIIIAYVCIFIIVNKSPRNVISQQDNSRINRTICIIVGLFILCWAPFFVTSLLLHKCLSCYMFIIENLWLRSLIKWLHYFNSCLNPLVYGIANAQYKDAFKAVFRQMCFRFVFKNQNENIEELNLPIYYPRQVSETSKALCIELTPEEKEPDGAIGGFRPINELQEDRYLPGDYRALPSFPTPRMKRLHSNNTTTTEESLLGANCLDDTEALQRALLNPESLTRTSYI